jgi:uncharacterized protein (DUF2141 family)
MSCNILMSDYFHEAKHIHKFMKRYTVVKVLYTLLMIIGSLEVYAQTVEVTITGIRSPEGQFVFRIFKDQESFRAEKPFEQRVFAKRNVLNGEMKLSFTMESGVFGLAIVDDESSNSEMDFNFMGLPKEGFGFSNYYHTAWTRPHFDSFKFMLSKEQKQKIVIKVRYL